MSWSLSRMARYVIQSKYLQQLKENDEVCLGAFDSASYMLFSRGTRPLLSSISDKLSIVWATSSEASSLSKEFKENSVLVSVDEGVDRRALFAISLDNPQDEEPTEKKYNGTFLDMRRAIMTLPTSQVQLVSRGYTLLNWHKNFKFCPSCTSPLKRNVAGTQLSCSKPCKPKMENFYPPTHPVAIVRVTDQLGEKILLVRQPRHPKGMYSCIAGFCEPGESLESSVRREIAEEAGIVVEQIQYFNSQTWPLPQNSLMLGCTAVAMPDSDKLDIDRGELECARWFTRNEVKDAIQRITDDISLIVSNEEEKFIIPPKGAIAFDLLKDWVQEESLFKNKI